MDIVCFGQQNWEVCWTGKQHLMTRLARRGHRVLYVDPDPPTAVAADTGGDNGGDNGASPDNGLLEVEPGLFVHRREPADATPPGRLGRRLRARLRRRLLTGAARRAGMLAPIAVSLRPDREWLADALNPAARVYFAVDEWTGFGGLDEDARRSLRRQEERALADCDLALAVSPRLAERFRLIQPRTHLLENGVDPAHFGPDALARADEHPRLAELRAGNEAGNEAGNGSAAVLGFVGQIDERLDAALIADLAARRPDWHFALAGRVKEGYDASPLTRLPNVHLLGYTPYERLPGVLRGVDVCLAPYVRSPLTESCNPLKVFEYVATGKPVVATPVEGLLACRGAVSLAEGAGAWQAAIEAALADPARGRDARLRVAAANTWDARADALEAHLRGALAGARRWTSGRRVRRLDPRLDAKDESVRRSHRGWNAATLGPGQRAAYGLSRLLGWAYYAARVARRSGGSGGTGSAGVGKILVVRRGYLGDMVVALPMLEALRRKFPRARIVLGVHPAAGSADLLTGVGAGGPVDEVRVLDFINARSRTQRIRGMASLFGEGFDLVVSGAWYFLMPESMFSGSPRRVGLYDGHPHQGRLDRAVPLDPSLHEAQNNLAVAEAVGATADAAQAVPRLRLDEARVEADGRALRESLALAADAPYVVIHPGSKRPSRRWPAERFAELCARLLQNRPELHVVVTGVAGEAELVRTVVEEIPAAVRARVRPAAGASGLTGLIGLLDRAAVLVCNDTGTMHLARARGVPLVAVLGPENDRRWGPHPAGPGPATVVRTEVPCSPCIRWKCESLFCLRSSGVEAVLAEVEALLAPEDKNGGAKAPLSLAVRRPLDELPADAFAVERRLRRRSWRDLADAGFLLPRVTVVILPAAGVGGDWMRRWDAAAEPDRPVDPRDEGEDAALRAAVAAVARQDYPNVEVVVAGRSTASDAAAAAPPSGLRVAWTAASSDAAAAWSRAAAEAHGDFVLPTSADACPAWAAGKIGADVATAYRSNADGAEAADGDMPFDAHDLHAAAVGVERYRADFLAARAARGGSPAGPVPEPRPLRFGYVTFRREALERALREHYGPDAVAHAEQDDHDDPAGPQPPEPADAADSNHADAAHPDAPRMRLASPGDQAHRATGGSSA